MVGGGDEHHGVRIGRGKMQRGDEDCGRGVPALRLDHDGAGVDPDLAQLLGHDEAEIGGGDDERRRIFRPAHPPRGLLKERRLTRERGELLGIGPPGQGPEPRAEAAAKEDGMDDRQSPRSVR